MRPARNLPPLLHGAVVVFLLLGLMTASPLVTPALAHKVNVFAWVEGDMVFVEGYFPGGRKAQNSLVEVFNKAGAKLLEGKTDERGEFSFTVPEKTDLKIVLTASMGHKNDFIIPASDFGGSASPLAIKPSQEVAESATISTAPNVDLDRLEAMLDKALDRKLEPVIRLVRDSRRGGPAITEIIGGVGYIFGLFGVALYFNKRRKREL